MDKVLLYINIFYSKTKLLVYKLKYKLLFLLNKQRTLQKMYEPLLKSRSKINIELNSNYKKLQVENRVISTEVQKLEYSNSSLKVKITVLQEMLIIKDL